MTHVHKPPFATELERSARGVDWAFIGLSITLCTVGLFFGEPWFKLSLLALGVGLGYLTFAFCRGKRRLRREQTLLCSRCSYPRSPTAPECPECGLNCGREEELTIWRAKYGPKAFEVLDPDSPTSATR